MNYNKRIDDLIEHYNKVNYLYNYNDNKDKVKDVLEKNPSNVSERIKNITDLVYLQEWKKLHIINKKIKIEEFIEKLKTEENNSNLNEIKKKIIENLYNKKLSNKDIQYDKINGKILDILCIIKEDDKFVLK